MLLGQQFGVLIAELRPAFDPASVVLVAGGEIWPLNSVPDLHWRQIQLIWEFVSTHVVGTDILCRAIDACFFYFPVLGIFPNFCAG